MTSCQIGHLQRPCFQIRSHAEALGVRTSISVGGEGTEVNPWRFLKHWLVPLWLIFNMSSEYILFLFWMLRMSQKVHSNILIYLVEKWGCISWYIVESPTFCHLCANIGIMRKLINGKDSPIYICNGISVSITCDIYSPLCTYLLCL